MAEQARGQNGEPAGPERKLEQGEAASEAMGVTVWCGARVRFDSCGCLAAARSFLIPADKC